MNKIFLYLIFGVFLHSCTALQMFKQEEITLLEKGAEPIEWEQNKLIVSAQVDGNKGKFLLDTGATTTVIFDTILMANFGNKQKGKLGRVRDAQKKTLDKTVLPVSFENGLAKATNKVVTYLPTAFNASKQDCVTQSNRSTDGIIGMDLYTSTDKEYALFLNFSEGKIENVSTRQNEKWLNDGFLEIKSKFSLHDQLYIYLELNEKEYKFKFDTGFTSDIVLPFIENIHFQVFTPTIVLGANYSTLSGLTSGKRTYYYEKIPVKMNSFEFTSNIQLTENLSIYNLGILFIKQFDWIIDFKNHKVYARKNGLSSTSKIPSINVNAYAEEGKLKIKMLGGSYLEKFPIGATIRSVNGEMVTSENLCEKLAWINQNKNWEDFDLEVEE